MTAPRPSPSHLIAIDCRPRLISIGVTSLVMLLLALSAVPLPAVDPEPPWRVAGAGVRLLTLPVKPLPHTVWLALPPQYHETCHDLEVLDHEGRPLTYYPVVIDGQLRAVEMVFTQRLVTALGRPDNQDPFAQSVQVYLLPDPGNKTFQPQFRTPVSLWTSNRKVIARPLTSAQYTAFCSRVGQPLFVGEISKLPAPSRMSALAEGLGNMQRLHYRQTTQLLVANARAWTPQVRNANAGAWFLFVDGGCVASWSSATPDGEGLADRPFDLVPGLHQIEFAGLLGQGERTPMLRFIRDGLDLEPQALEPEQLYAANFANALLIERLDDVLLPGLQIDWREQLHFAGTDTLLTQARVRNCSRHLFGRRIRLDQLTVGAATLTDLPPGGLVYLPREAELPVTMRVSDELGFRGVMEATFNQFLTRPRTVRVEVRITELPMLLPVDKPLRIPFEIGAPPTMLQQLLPQARVRLRHLGAADRIISRSYQKISAFPTERYVDTRASADELETLELAVVVGEAPVAAPLRIRLPRPSVLDDFGSRGGILTSGDDLAILRRHYSTAAPQVPRPTGTRRIVIVDDFIATQGHATDHLDLVAQMRAEHHLQVTHEIVCEDLKPGVPAPQLKYRRLSAALNSTAEIVVLAVGVSDIVAGSDLRDFRSQLQFMVLTTLARGKYPVLVTPPVHGQLTQSRLRDFALAIKELAVSRGLPVADLYSASLQHGSLEAFYQLGSARSATPNAAGRRWYLQCLAQTLTSLSADSGK